jgi:glutamine synthetase
MAFSGVDKTNYEVFMNVPFDQLFTWLKDHKITEVECVVSDLTGIARGKILPTNKFLNEHGMRLPESVLLQTVTGDYVDDDIYYNLLDPADIDMTCRPTRRRSTFCRGPSSRPRWSSTTPSIATATRSSCRRATC